LLTWSCEQTNDFAVPYCVSVHGIHFQNNTLHWKSITELYLTAAKTNERLNNRNPEELIRKFEDQQSAFTVERGAFTSLLTQYHGSYRNIVADIFHDIFSMPRSGNGPSSSSTGKVDAIKLNAIHEMLRLQVGEAALGTNHPVCREYPPEAGGCIRRVFPSKGSAGVQVFTKHGDPQSETAKFVKALGGIGLF